MSRFAGRTIFVAGSTGMAASAVRALASEGAGVFVASRTAEHAVDLASAVETDGGEIGWAAADLAHEAAVEDAFAACAERFGPRLDGLYHVAGISGRRFGDGPVHEASLEGWQAVMTANAQSTFLTMRAAVRRMRAQEPDADGQRGAILLMSSVLATHPSPEHFATHAYAASKGAIEALTRATASAYAVDGIRVNAIAPGLVATPMSRRAQDDPDILAKLRRRQPLAADGPIDADAVTDVAIHLLSREARMVTGQVIAVDGGWGVSEAPPRG
jgi:NAD(P)-dependent dehydrogenase (short-subunit alcohol dehydrogenase family)